MSKQTIVECEICGADAYEDEVEGICPECGNSWILDDDLFEERIEYERNEGEAPRTNG